MKRWPAILLLAAGTVCAQDAPREPVVRVDAAPDSVNVGEAVQLRVTVLVPTWFARPPVYPDFELANAITRLPPDSSYPTSERIGRDSWSGIIRSYRVYPLAGATYRMAGEKVEVAYAHPGGDAIEREVAVPEIEFSASVPAGAEGLDPYIAGRSVTLTLETGGSPADLEAGDAVVLRYTAELDGLPAIFLPPLAPALDMTGVSVYPDQPEVSDGPPARRSEKLTLVFDAGGEFTVPPVELAYWNTATKTVDTVSADGPTFSVAGPATASDRDGEPTLVDWRTIVAILVAIAVISLLLAMVLRRTVPRLGAALSFAARRRRESETHAFRDLEAALRSGSSREAYERLLGWTGKLEPPVDSREFAARYGDARLQAALENCHARLFGERSGDGGLNALAAGLAAARKRYRGRSRTVAPHRLPPLNPV